MSGRASASWAPAPPLTSRFSLRLDLGIGAKLAAAFLLVVTLAAIFAPIIAPQDPNALNLLDGLQNPSWAHLLGQDASGRDLLSRLIWGARLSLLGPSAVVALSLVVGVPLGVVAGWRGGFVDTVVSRVSDAVLAFPPLLLAIVIAAAFGAGFLTAIVAIAITYVPLLARVVRGLVLVEREKPYVEAFRCHGFGTLALVSKHVYPNVSAKVSVQAVVSFGYALIDLAGLSFLGLGVQPPTSDWGSMLAEGRSSLLINPTEVIVVALTIALTVLSINVLGDALTAWAERTR
jgi:peptide/nickel transport system permease protein